MAQAAIRRPNFCWRPHFEMAKMNGGAVCRGIRRNWEFLMAMVTVQVWDATGNKRRTVEMPTDAPVNRLLAVLLEKMMFPQFAPDGLPLSYKFHHRGSGKQLLDEQTLADAGVKDGDVLRLQPEITAG
jgi:hypothetical protein